MTDDFRARAAERTPIAGKVVADPAGGTHRVGRLLRPIEVEPNPSYRYTTPSVLGKRGKKARKDRGCIERTVDFWCFKPEGKKSDKCFRTEEEANENAAGRTVRYKPGSAFTGMRCRTKLKKGEQCTDKVYDAFCWGSDSKPCGSARSTCPVQLVWVDGKPNLRFCKQLGEPGYLVPVKDVKEAMKISTDACAQWPYKLGTVEKTEGDEGEGGGWDPEFFDRNAPEILKKAKKAYPKRGGLGQVAPAQRRPQGLGSPLWLMGGAALGLLASGLMRR